MPTLIHQASTSGAGNAYEWAGGSGTFSAQAITWNGATIKLQYSKDHGSTWLDTGVSRTANGGGNFELGGCRIRSYMTGATAAGTASAWVGTHS